MSTPSTLSVHMLLLELVAQTLNPKSEARSCAYIVRACESKTPRNVTADAADLDILVNVRGISNPGIFRPAPQHTITIGA